MTNVTSLTKPEKETIRVMVDTETLGLKADAIILAIGAVVWDIDRDLGDEFYVEIDPATYLGEIEIETMKFWMLQAAAGNPCPCEGTIGLSSAWAMFYNWLQKISDYGTKRLEIWSNGTDFDIPKLYYAAESLGEEILWAYNDVRDYRTIAKEFGKYGEKPEKACHHNALSDAIWQAKHLISILGNLKERLNAF
jgi:DNA polymerase III epsilon subunit-like protein